MVDKDENENQIVSTTIPQSLPTSSSASLTTTTTTSIMNNIPTIDELDDFDIDHEALEQELGSLLEEDMEAAVNSLLYPSHNGNNGMNLHHHYNSNDNNNTISSSGGGMLLLPPLGSLPGTPQIDNKSSSGNKSGDGISSRTTTTTLLTPKSKTTTASVSNDKNNNTATTTHIKSPPSMSPTRIVTTKSSSITGGTTTSTSATNPIPTEDQVLKLQKLMADHYQILLQQATLAIRAAHGNKYNKDGSHSSSSSVGSSTYLQQGLHSHYYDYRSSQPQPPQQQPNTVEIQSRKRHHDFFFSGETADDLSMIIDGAVTMLQDLDENRKDAIRYAIQMSRTRRKKRRLDNNVSGLYSNVVDGTSNIMNDDDGDDENGEIRGWLTRSAFSRTLQEQKWGGDGTPEYEEPSQKSNQSINSTLGFGANTIFGVKGLARLDQTFAAIDNSLNTAVGGNAFGGIDIFEEPDHGRACELLLVHARADYDSNLIPGYRDLSELLTFPGEFLGSPAQAVNKIKDMFKMSKEQQMSLRKNRGQFTTSEDNLLLRGVNLYGEKEWTLISDRYLPDRSVSSISQRYWRLCLLIYKGQGIVIDDKGDLEAPSDNLKGIEDYDEELISKTLKRVAKPIECGLYRWSMEEDIMLLKSVPLMGRMFSEIKKRFIPHRDRGALRKRYQVLERRVKTALKRDKKSANDIVRKNVAPLMEAISIIKKDSLPGNARKDKTATQRPNLPTYTNPIKQSTVLSSSLQMRPSQVPPTILSSASQASVNQRNSSFVPTTHLGQHQNDLSYRINHQNNPQTTQAFENQESPSKNDTTSHLGFEKLINGDYSNMSDVKNFIENADNQTKEGFNSAQNQGSRHLPMMGLPNFALDNSCSGLSMLSSIDMKASNMGKNNDDNNGRNEDRLLSSVLGGSNVSTIQAPSSPPKHSILGDLKVDHNEQSMDILNFSQLRSPIQHTFDRDQGLLRTPRTPTISHMFPGTPHGETPTAFSNFPNAQASNFYHNIANSLMVPDHHEVDAAAATLSQMSNSSATFPANLLSSLPNTPDRNRLASFPNTPDKNRPPTDANKSSNKSGLSFFQQVTKKFN